MSDLPENIPTNAPSALKPCPHCGGCETEAMGIWPWGHARRCGANGCMATGPYGKTQEDADVKWNTRAPAPMAEVTEVTDDAGALNGLLDRLQAAVWSAAHVRQYDLTGQESARAKISAIRQEIRDHCCKRVIRAHEANGAVIKAAQRLHAAINAAEINYDSWHGKTGAPPPPSHEVQQALSKECVEADEEMTNALSAFLAGRMGK